MPIARAAKASPHGSASSWNSAAVSIMIGECVCSELGGHGHKADGCRRRRACSFSSSSRGQSSALGRLAAGRRGLLAQHLVNGAWRSMVSDCTLEVVVASTIRVCVCVCVPVCSSCVFCVTSLPGVSCGLCVERRVLQYCSLAPASASHPLCPSDLSVFRVRLTSDVRAI
jgi:hypothetical protein